MILYMDLLTIEDLIFTLLPILYCAFTLVDYYVMFERIEPFHKLNYQSYLLLTYQMDLLTLNTKWNFIIFLEC